MYEHHRQIGLLVCMVATMCALFNAGCDDSNADGNAESRTEQAERADGLDAAGLEAALVAADEYLRGDEASKAETILRELVGRVPQNPDVRELLARAIFQRAVAAAREGDAPRAATLYVEAYEQYEQVVILQGDVAGLQQNAGEFAIAAGRVEEAAGHFSAARSLDPTNAKHALYHAQMLLQLDRVTESRDAIEAAIEIDPDEPYAVATLASVLAAEEDWDQAVAEAGRARSLAATRAEERVFRLVEAKVLRQAGRPADALRLLLPLDPVARVQEGVTGEIALSYEAQGRYADAAEVWGERFARTGDWRAAVKAGEAALRGNQPDAASMWLREAQAANPGGAAEIESLARSLRDATQRG